MIVGELLCYFEYKCQKHLNQSKMKRTKKKCPNLRSECNVKQHHAVRAVIRVVHQNARARIKAHQRRLHQSDEHEGDQRPEGHTHVQAARLV
jgi:hypothetical protein